MRKIEKIKKEISMLTPKVQKNSLIRLKRIEGQIKGIQRMVEEKKYCVDILLQISAVYGALRKVGHIILKNHVETCVAEAIDSSDEKEKNKKIEELMEVFDRFVEYKR